MTTPTQTIGRYRIQRELGRGAMGIVYLALDPLLMRLVAIKVVSEIQGDNSEALARFHREALISAKLNHPNIITIFDVGEDPVLGPFMAMEYVDGVTLAALIQERLPQGNGLSLLVQLMSALMASELAGVCHRDVKPDNVLVGKDWCVKLLDFGIAHGDEVRITQTGMVFSTPNYAAPELLLGCEASSRSDRYSFAVTAFEVLSGVLPFNGSSLGSVLYSIVQEPATMPACFSPQLKKVFQRALAKDPHKRYPDLLSFMDALLEVVELTEEENNNLQIHIGELRAQGLQGPMATDSTPIRKLNLQRGTKVLKQVLASVKRKAPWARKSQVAAIAGSRAGAIHKATLLGGTLLLGIAASTLLFLAKPVRSGVAAWLAGTRRVNITSSPGSAMMFLDNQPIGMTPAYGLGIKGSAHTLRVELAGYRTQTREIRAGESKHYFSLQAEAFYIPVNTDPSGAQIFLNDQPMGSTPMAALKVPTESRQELVMRLPGYQDWRAVVDAELPLSNPIRLNPKPTSSRRH